MEGPFRSAVLAAQIGTLRPGLMLGQDADNLFFAVSRSLHCLSLRWGGPLISGGEKIPLQVNCLPQTQFVTVRFIDIGVGE